MSWLRYGDEFTVDRRWDGVPYDARWHYLCLVAEASRSERYDCRLPIRMADRASDVADPGAATEALVQAGFIAVEDGLVVIVDGEAKHMPSESQRDKKRKEGQRERTRRHRLRKCEAGDHDADCPTSCPVRSSNGSRNALRGNEGDDVDQSHAPGEMPDFDPDTGEIRESNGVRNALRRDRTGRDRTALGVEPEGNVHDISRFVSSKANP